MEHEGPSFLLDGAILLGFGLLFVLRFRRLGPGGHRIIS